MKLIRNEKGVALVMVTIIALIGLAMVSTLLFMVTQGTRISGFQKVFRSTDEAGLGGAQVATQVIRDNIFNAKSGLDLESVIVSLGATDDCLREKLRYPRGAWDISHPATYDPAAVYDPVAYYWPNCTGDRALKIDADKTPDFTFDVDGANKNQKFTVYAKIIDTVKGNTEESGLGGGKLGGSGVVSAQEGQITPAPTPTLYRIEVQAQDKTNPEQRSKYSILYGY